MKMRKTKAYIGCEWESPIYRQIMSEKGMKVEGGVVEVKQGKKRGKRK